MPNNEGKSKRKINRRQIKLPISKYKRQIQTVVFFYKVAPFIGAFCVISIFVVFFFCFYNG